MDLDEGTSLAEKILGDIAHIFRIDPLLEEFCVVPTTVNTNKSPVLHAEHCLGLESWCVKLVYKHLCDEIFSMRKYLRKNRVPVDKVEPLDYQLIGALLLHSDVTTFWNMRRELVEFGYIPIDKELLLTKLVLSHKSKSNDAFSYRRWILTRSLKSNEQSEIVDLQEECSVTEMAATKSQNNYHAWTHRIWTLENVATNTDCVFEMSTQLNFSLWWINNHVSEYSGFHFRQYLFEVILKSATLSSVDFTEKDKVQMIQNCLGIKLYDDGQHLLEILLGKKNGQTKTSSSQFWNYFSFLYLLLTELLSVIKQLNDTFPGHEAIWYHRRYIIYKLLWAGHEYHNHKWRENVQIRDLDLFDSQDLNITNIPEKEKHNKMCKYENNMIEVTHLHRIIVEIERNNIKESTESKCEIQRELAQKHEKWLKVVLCLNGI